MAYSLAIYVLLCYLNASIFALEGGNQVKVLGDATTIERIASTPSQGTPSLTTSDTQTIERDINCEYTGWYMTEDGRLFRCSQQKGSDSSVSPVRISVNPEISQPSAQLLPSGLSGVTTIDETKFSLPQDLAELYGEPYFDPLHLLKPVVSKPVETHVKPVEPVKPITKPVGYVKPIIKPIELKPIIYKPVIKPIEKPLVLKPIVYKPIIAPIHKPLAIKPVIHKPFAIKPHLKPMHVAHHLHKPCHHTIKKPHLYFNSAQLVPHHAGEGQLFAGDGQLFAGANSQGQPGLSGLHPTGHGAVNHELKSDENEGVGALTPLYAWAPPFLPSLYHAVPYDGQYFITPNTIKDSQPVEQESQADERVHSNNANRDYTVPASDKTEPTEPAQVGSGKTIPEIRNVIENIQQSIQRIPSVLGIQGFEANVNNKDEQGSPQDANNNYGQAESGTKNEENIIDSVADAVKSDAAETSEANIVISTTERGQERLEPPVRRLDVPEDEIVPESVSQAVSDISSSVQPDDGKSVTLSDSETDVTPDTTADESSDAADVVRSQDEFIETPVENDYIQDDQEGSQQQSRRKRNAPAIPIEILQDKETSDAILDKTTLLEIMTTLKEEYLKNAKPDQRKLIEDAFDRLHCSVRDMKQTDERPIGKKMHSPERATLELLAEHIVQPMVDYADYYNDGTEEISAEPTFLELLNVAEHHKNKAE